MAAASKTESGKKERAKNNSSEQETSDQTSNDRNSESQKSADDMSYEEAFAQLESILAKLENDDLALDDSLAFYEQGMVLVERCSHLLDSATLRVQQWQPDGDTAAFTGWQEG